MNVTETQYRVAPMQLRESHVNEGGFSRQLRSAELSAETSIGSVVAGQVNSILREETALDEMMDRSMRGEGMDQRQMLEMQATVYAYSQRLEVATRVVDRSASAVKQLLNTQL